MKVRAEVTRSRSPGRSGLAAPAHFSSHYRRRKHSTSSHAAVQLVMDQSSTRTPLPLKGIGPESSAPNSPLRLIHASHRLSAGQFWYPSNLGLQHSTPLKQFAFSGAQVASRVLLRCSLQSRRTTVTPIPPCFSCFGPSPQVFECNHQGSEIVRQFPLCSKWIFLGQMS